MCAPGISSHCATRERTTVAASHRGPVATARAHHGSHLTVRRYRCPATETKELIGGLAIREAASKDEAIRLGEQFMQLHADVLGQSYEGTLEVRPMFEPAGAGCS